MKFHIVNTDNFGGDYPAESFVDGVGPFNTREAAQTVADTLNIDGDYAPSYYKVVELPYTLRPGFEA